jgi:hypothetical protein
MKFQPISIIADYQNSMMVDSPLELGSLQHRIKIYNQMVDNFFLFGTFGLETKPNTIFNGTPRTRKFVDRYFVNLLSDNGKEISARSNFDHFIRKSRKLGYVHDESKDTVHFKKCLRCAEWTLGFTKVNTLNLIRDINEKSLYTWQARGGFMGLPESERIQMILTTDTIPDLIEEQKRTIKGFDSENFHISFCV